MPIIPLDIDIAMGLGASPLPQRSRWRAKYTSEGGNDNPPNMPAVLPAQRWMGNGYGKYIRPIPFTQPMQWLSWFLMSKINPTITMKQWGAVYAGDRWGTNGNGWDNSTEPDDQRRDYVQDRYRGYPDPKLMDALIFAGSVYSGEEDEHHVIMRPGVDGIDVLRPLPSVDEILAKGWYMLATSNTNPPSHFPQGNGGPVAIPYFLIEPAMYPKAWFVKVS